ncbi:hypothetical protein [Streptomyces sp. NPDC015414]|uniref:hypothetical protein n=1 Tax=Streptomyces sp. NPDC015414 TaxID=3364957 RepID=UPI0036F72C34
MPAGHEGTGEHGGMDALMAAITGTPLPPDAHDDPVLLAEHRSAEADVAVLKEQLTWLAEALTGEPRPERPARGPAAADEPGGAASGPAAAGSGPDGPPAGGAGRARSVRRPGGAGRPARTGGVRRGVRVVLGSVAGVLALGLVAGLGWAVVARSGGGASMSSDKSADAKSRADAPGRAATGPVLSCYRLLAEGTVERVDRRTRAPRIRVVLTVTRSYRPAHGPSEVSFLLDDAASPAPRQGQHVLAGVDRGGQEATLWAVGDAGVAAERARINGTAPGSAPAPCGEP